MQKLSENPIAQFLWDTWCVVSVVGIWPRFIEPKLVTTAHIDLPIANLPPKLEGLRILQISDLHLSKSTPNCFLDKILSKIKTQKPDLIVFTGDFLCYSFLDDPERLKEFFSSMIAPAGCFAILGNHDYLEPTMINDDGDYDLFSTRSSTIKRALTRLISAPPSLSKEVTSSAKAIGLHEELVKTLRKTPFQLLHNETKTISYRGEKINICGLGEHTLGRSLPHLAFEHYLSGHLGIILAHNPDAMTQLLSYPGEVILSGHTHGAQVNLPWLRNRFTQLENMQYLKGLFPAGDNKWLYINRGLGSVFPFRWFAPPEITVFTLRLKKHEK